MNNETNKSMTVRELEALHKQRVDEALLERQISEFINKANPQLSDLASDSSGYGLPEVEQLLKETRQRIDEILFYQWDPINLSRSNWPRCEYSTYARVVFSLVLDGYCSNVIAQYLSYVSSELILLPTSWENDQEVAGLISSLLSGELYTPDHDVLVI